MKGNVYIGTVLSSNTTAVGPASSHTYTVLVETDSGQVRMAGVRPWFQQWADEVHVNPYPPSTEIIVIQRGNDWRYLFPGQRPKTGGCP